MSRQKGLSFAENKKVVSTELVREIFGTAFFCFAAILLAVVLTVAFGYRIKCSGSSMEGTLYNGQEVLVDRFTFKLLSPSRGDVVCFYPKGNENANVLIKRVVGLPGETIEIKDGYVYVDGVRYIESDEFDLIEDAGDAENKFVLGTDEYFVLGDNRNNSEDSRTGNIGAVLKDTMIGKAWFKLKDSQGNWGFIK